MRRSKTKRRKKTNSRTNRLEQIETALREIKRLGTRKYRETIRVLELEKRKLQKNRSLQRDRDGSQLSIHRKSTAKQIPIRTTKGEKISRGWRFVKAIKENYSNDPTIKNLSSKKMRSEYKKFREGRESQVPDVVWQNPSP